MKDIFQFIDQLVPDSVRVPALLGVILVYLYPHLRSSWFDLRYRTAFLDFTKRQLEILKLSCEIEGLRRTHQLTDTRFELPPFLPSTAAAPSAPKQGPHDRLPRFTAGLLAAGGCLTSFAIRIAFTFARGDQRFSEFTGSFPVSYFLGVLVLCLIAGSVASLLSYRTRPYSFVIGLLFPWTIWGIVALFTNYAGLVSPIQRNG